MTRTADILLEHAGKVFQTGDLVLNMVEDHIRDLTEEEIASPATNAYLAKIKAPIRQIISVWIENENGDIQASSTEWKAGSNASGRDFFEAQRPPGAHDFVSPVYRGKSTGLDNFAVSRRRTAKDGKFAGIVHVNFTPEYFSRFFADAAPQLVHAAILMRDDGSVLARDPVRATDMRLSSDSPLMQAIARSRDSGFLSGKSSMDGKSRIYAYRKVGAYPVYVGFGIETALMVNHWIRDMAPFAFAAAAASAILVMMSWQSLRGRQKERLLLVQLRQAMVQLERETAQREAAEEHRHQAQKTEAIGQLSAGIAHDFNNLLAVIMGSLELLQRHMLKADGKAVRLLTNARQSAERGAELTKRLLSFGRRQTLAPAPVALPKLVMDMSSLLRSAIGSGITLETIFPATVSRAMVDANQLELALLNLAANARDAMDGAGTLTIQAFDAPGSVGLVVLSVTDTGSGMDAATLARATEPFFTTKGVGKGTGLGLSMVYGLAAQSGGEFVLRSAPGAGTTAEIWLPVALSSTLPASATGRDRPAGAIRAPRTVMVVDDDPLVLESVGAMLEDMGHAVVPVGSGAEALDLLPSKPDADLVLTDQAMPGMTGLQLAAAVGRVRPDLPVLLMTGFAEHAEVKSSGLPLIAKPFQQDALASAIRMASLVLSGA